ncbi:macrophage mannose receptor 1-like [Mya arenaria]|nr:macrophage mannose receptor 1-like [Mya arenaria]
MGNYNNGLLCVIHLLLVTLLKTLVSADGPLCFHCTRIPLPLDCSHVIQCEAHESCSVQQFVSDGGHIYFDVGCFDISKCQTKRDVTINELDDITGDIITCRECCNGNYCNIQGCGSRAPPGMPDRGPLCFNCDSHISMDSCETMMTCSVDQECETLATTQSSCTGCCKTDFCNRDCAINTSTSNTHSSPTTVETTVPSTHLTTSATTVQPHQSTTHTSVNSGVSTSTKATPPSTNPSKPTNPIVQTSTQTVVVPTVDSLVTHERMCSLLGYAYYHSLDLCLKIHTDHPLSWRDANSACRHDGGTLAMFKHVTDRSILDAWSKQHLGDLRFNIQYFVGAVSNGNGNWTWLDGTQVNQNLFLPGEPSHGEHEDCSSFFLKDGTILLNDDVCDGTLAKFICGIDLGGLTKQQPLYDRQFCRNADYTPRPDLGLCYKVYDNERKPQADARVSCHVQGAELLQIRTRGIEQVFQNLPYKDRDHDENRYWLGAERRDGQFYWFNGQRVGGNTAMAWDANEPNNYKGHENCLDFKFSNEGPTPDSIAFNDDNCDNPYFYICEERCPNTTYQYFHSSHLDLCYHVIPKRVTWAEANAYCVKEHANLLAPDSIDKLDFFGSILKASASMWVGATASQATSQYHWTINNHVISSDLLHNSDHTGIDQQKCVLMSMSQTGQNMILSSANCNDKHTFVCQYMW